MYNPKSNLTFSSSLSLWNLQTSGTQQVADMQKLRENCPQAFWMCKYLWEMEQKQGFNWVSDNPSPFFKCCLVLVRAPEIVEIPLQESKNSDAFLTFTQHVPKDNIHNLYLL